VAALSRWLRLGLHVGLGLQDIDEGAGKLIGKHQII